MKNTTTIKSWGHLQKVLFDDSLSTRSSIDRFRSEFVFRGLSNKDYDLKPSLNRVCDKSLHLEKHLIRNFKKYLNISDINRDNFWELIALAQHHGLPTRLLDWTTSPIVAAHFATEDFSKYNTDGIIWCLNTVELHNLLPDELNKIIAGENAYIFTTEMLNKYKNFDDLEKISTTEFFFMYEPPSIDDRIVNQYALFSVASNSNLILSNWLLKYPNLYKKIIIPKEKKLEIRDRLDQMNMTERVIYSGLDGLCKWLSRYYTPTETIKKIITTK